ncbi:MAG TPA: S9 family peptidase [Candidatus Rubrimentiphilum sp.]|nr:S9 family peptidase [Candidatus Rubrimentiphilum sp.]
MIRALRILPLFFFAFAAIAPAATPKVLTFEDLRRVVAVRAPHISPDGTRIAYVRSTVDWKADRNRTELVLVNVDGTGARALTRGRIGVDNPQWSPDGTRLAFLASPELGKPAQLYVMPMNGGDALQITTNKAGVQNYAWRPDGNALAYVSDDDPANQKALDNHLDAVTITDNDYLTREAPQAAHLWQVNADGSSANRLTSGSWSVVKGTAPVWASDGSKIYYQRQPDPIFAHMVSQTTFVYNVGQKTNTDLGLGVNADAKICGSPLFSAFTESRPRHDSLYLTQDVSVRVLGRMDAEIWNSGASIDRNVHWYGCSDGDLFVASTDGVRSIVWDISLQNATGTRFDVYPGRGAQLSRSLDHGRIPLGDVDFGADATVGTDGAIAFVGLRRDRPAEIYYLPAGSSTPHQVSNENAWMNDFQIAKSEAFEWQTDMGTKAVGVLTYPVHYVPGHKYPLVLDIHGGPVSTSTWDMAGVEGMRLVQILAAHDYFVFRPNYRGSDNMGDAFLQAIVGDVTSGPGRDNLAAVAALRATGMIDENRIAVSGWSGGGLQTSWLIGHANFWRAAVMGAAVTDWYQQALLADINENFAQTFFSGALPFSKTGRAAYAAESPITFVDNVKTPTLILSDTRDQRVPVSQAYTFYHALRDRGVPVKFTAFPRYGHFATDPVGIEITLRAWAGWLDRWLK